MVLTRSWFCNVLIFSLVVLEDPDFRTRPVQHCIVEVASGKSSTHRITLLEAVSRIDEALPVITPEIAAEVLFTVRVTSEWLKLIPSILIDECHDSWANNSSGTAFCNMYEVTSVFEVRNLSSDDVFTELPGVFSHDVGIFDCKLLVIARDVYVITVPRDCSSCFEVISVHSASSRWQFKVKISGNLTIWWKHIKMVKLNK